MGREVERQLTDTPADALHQQHVVSERIRFARGDERLDLRNFSATG